jgi:hypothetical protein
MQPGESILRLIGKFTIMKTFLSIIFSLFVSCSFAQNEGNFHLDKEYKIGQHGLVRLQTSDAKVTITGSSRTTAHVKIDREVTTRGLTFGHERFYVEVNEGNDDLDIREHSSSVSVGVVGYYSEKYTITIEIPTATGLAVKGDDGYYFIQNVGGAISMKLDDGSAELTGCTGDQFDFRLDDGNLKMDQGRGRIEITGDDTDVQIRQASFTQFRANIDDGDLVLETSIPDNGNYSIRAQDGMVALTVISGGANFDIHYDDGRITMEGAFKIIDKSESDMQVMLASGKANVSIHADDARVKLVAR